MHYKNSIAVFKNKKIREIPCDKRVYINRDFISADKENNKNFIEFNIEKNNVNISMDGNITELRPYEKIVYEKDMQIIYLINQPNKLLIKDKPFITIGSPCPCSVG